MESPGKQLDGSVDVSTLKDKISALEKEEKFGEAYRTLQNLGSLLEQSKRHKMRRLSSSQQDRSKVLESNYNSALSEHNARWAEALDKFNKVSQEERQNLLSLNKEKLEQLRADLERDLPPQPKPSLAILNLVKCKEKAVKSKQYLEAEWLAENIKIEKRKELQLYQEQRNAKIKTTIDKQAKVLQTKVASLELKQKAALDELLIQKQEETKKLRQKFTNIRKSLDTAQNIETNKASGRHTTVAGRHTEYDPAIDLYITASSRNKWTNHPKSPIRRYLNLSI